MLYVNNQDESVKFWTENLGFTVIHEENAHGIRWIQIAPTKSAETSIILHNKEVIAQMSPELNLGTPSLMFFSDQFDVLYNKLVNNNVTVGEVMKMPTGRVFNFADNEENYFAVMDKS